MGVLIVFCDVLFFFYIIFGIVIYSVCFYRGVSFGDIWVLNCFKFFFLLLFI